MYTYPSVAINNMTFTALRWGQFPTITYTLGATAGAEVVTLASDLSNISVQIADGVSTNLQIKTAVLASLVTKQSLFPSDLVSIAITGGHNSDTNTSAGPSAMTGAASSPAPSPMSRTIPSSLIVSTFVDWSIAKMYRKTLSANTTLTFANAADGLEIEIFITNTASNYIVTWPAGIKWVGGSAPTQTVGAKTDIYRLRQVGTTIYATAAQNLS